MGFLIDPAAEGVEPMVLIPPTEFDAKIVVQNSELALKSAKEEYPGLVYGQMVLNTIKVTLEQRLSGNEKVKTTGE